MNESLKTKQVIWKRSSFWLGLTWLPFLLCTPFLIYLYITPEEQKFPRKIFDGMTIDSATRKLKPSENSDWKNPNLSLTTYVFRDSAGKVIQEVDGNYDWNISLLYDLDVDGVPEFLLRQVDFKGVRKPQWIACYKFQGGRFVFSRWIPREEFGLYLDYKFFGAAYWTLILKVSLFCFQFATCITTIYLVFRWLLYLRKRRSWTETGFLIGKLIFAALLIFLGGLIGVWIGEEILINNPFGWQECLGLALPVVWFLALKKKSFTFRIILAVASLGSFVGGDLYGRREFRNAFNECVDGGEDIRQDLEAYKKSFGTYPDTIKSLEVTDPGLSGKVLLRGNILDYKKTPSGYEISFRDWLVTHTATESKVFRAFQ